jgi:molecular chaperone GrpE
MTPKEEEPVETPDAEPVGEAVEAAPEPEPDWKDRYLRALAELDNSRKRAEREADHRRRYALEGFLRELLPVLDALEHATDAGDAADAIREGLRLALADAGNILKRAGVEPIEAKGQPFDPRLHEALGMEPAPPGQAPGTVLREVRRGYRFHDRVLRPSRVFIAIAPPAPAASTEEE